MKVLVDTCIWSASLRRKNPSLNPNALELKELISEGRVLLIGPIRQEILSGVKNDLHYHSLRDHFQAFEDLNLLSEDFERGAFFYNLCRAKGVQGSNTDFLICAVAERHHLSIFTSDKDFSHFSKYLPIKLHQLRKQ